MMCSEAALWSKVPPLAGWEFNPAALLWVVNSLQARGVDEATGMVLAQAIAIDRAEQSVEDGYAALGRLYLVARLLWCPAPPHRAWPVLQLGRPDVDLPPPDALWPLLPVVLSQDVPFLLVGGYKAGGALLAAHESIKILLAMAQWRSQLLLPQSSPMAAMQNLVASQLWGKRIPKAQRGLVEALLQAQARRAEEWKAL